MKVNRGLFSFRISFCIQDFNKSAATGNFKGKVSTKKVTKASLLRRNTTSNRRKSQEIVRKLEQCSGFL